MKKILSSMIVILLVMSCLTSAYFVFAAETLKAENFIEIYPMGGMEIGISDDPAGAKLEFKKIDSRVTLCGPTEEEMWGRILPLNTLVIKMSDITYSTPTSLTNGKTLAFTFSKEAGSFYATGATGLHIRLFHTKDGCFIYAKKADAPDTGDDVYIAYSPIPEWTRIPEDLTMKIYKTGSDYTLDLNGLTWTISAENVEKNISRSGKVFINIGVMGINNFDFDMIVNQIYNDDTLIETVSSAPESSSVPSSAASSSAVSSMPESSEETSSEEEISSDVSSEIQVTSEESSAFESEVTSASGSEAEGGKLSGDASVVKIDNEAMTMNVKLGTSYAQLFEALTITGDYEIEFLNPDDRVILDESNKLENDSKVRIVSGEDVLAVFTVAVLSSDDFDAIGAEDNQDNGMPVYLIVIIIIAGAAVLGGAGYFVYRSIVKKNKAEKQDNDDQIEE